MFSVEEMVADIAVEKPEFVAEWSVLLQEAEAAGRSCSWGDWLGDWEDVLCEADELVSGCGVAYFYREELLDVVRSVFETAAGFRR